MINKYYKYSDEELLPFLNQKKQIAESAFNVLYSRYHIRVFEYFLSRLHERSNAEDLHQDTFINFYNIVMKGQQIQKVESYLFKIAKNVLINHELRSHIKIRTSDKMSRDRKISIISLDEVDYLESIISEENNMSFETQELIDLIKWAVNQLDEKYKNPFIDRKEYDLSIKEIAEKYKLSYEGAKKRVDRASNKIKDILEIYIKEINN